MNINPRHMTAAAAAAKKNISPESEQTQSLHVIRMGRNWCNGQRVDNPIVGVYLVPPVSKTNIDGYIHRILF